MKVFKCFLLFLFLLPSTLWAKDLTGRLGIGFINEFSNSTSFFQVPNISAKYSLTKDIAVLGCAGINTENYSGYTLCGKFFKNIFFETNLNFYATAGAALVKAQNVGVDFIIAFGAEFFVPGVDSLGLSFEAGTSLTNVSGEFEFRTVGYTFIHAGMHFYF